MPLSDINPDWKLVAIGRGSFAIVSILSGRPVAFKHVISSTRTPELKAEFEALCSIYDICNTDSFFALPRPLAYYDPQVSTSFVSADSSPLNIARTRVRRHRVIEEDFRLLGLESAAYAMGKVIETADGRPRRFFNSANFSLDVSRYRKMMEALDTSDYPTVDDIAYGMAEFLGRLYWRGGYDGRDIEFIMGGASFSGVAMYVIDFNQVSRHPSTPKL